MGVDLFEEDMIARRWLYQRLLSHYSELILTPTQQIPLLHHFRRILSEKHVQESAFGTRTGLDGHPRWENPCARCLQVSNIDPRSGAYFDY